MKNANHEYRLGYRQRYERNIYHCVAYLVFVNLYSFHRYIALQHFIISAPVVTFCRPALRTRNLIRPLAAYRETVWRSTCKAFAACVILYKPLGSTSGLVIIMPDFLLLLICYSRSQLKHWICSLSGFEIDRLLTCHYRKPVRLVRWKSLFHRLPFSLIPLSLSSPFRLILC